MKNHILLLIAIMSFSVSRAQVLTGGPEIGLNFSNMQHRFNGVKTSGDMIAGLKLGAVLDMGFTRQFSFQPGLFFSMKGYELHSVSNVVIGGLAYREEIDAELRANYFEVPLNFQYKFGMPTQNRFFIGAGPYVAAAIGGDIKTERTRTLLNSSDGWSTKEVIERDLEVGTNGAFDDISPFDAGININGGYESRRGMYARLNFGLGLANINPDGTENNSIRNFSIGISAGYLFGK